MADRIALDGFREYLNQNLSVKTAHTYAGAVKRAALRLTVSDFDSRPWLLNLYRRSLSVTMRGQFDTGWRWYQKWAKETFDVDVALPPPFAAFELPHPLFDDIEQLMAVHSTTRLRELTFATASQILSDVEYAHAYRIHEWFVGRRDPAPSDLVFCKDNGEPFEDWVFPVLASHAEILRKRLARMFYDNLICFMSSFQELSAADFHSTAIGVASVAMLIKTSESYMSELAPLQHIMARRDIGKFASHFAFRMKDLSPYQLVYLWGRVQR